MSLRSVFRDLRALWIARKIRPLLGNEKAYLNVRYRNWRGEVAARSVRPESLYFGSTEYYPNSQLLLQAYDFDRRAYRTFAVANIEEIL